MEGMPLPKVVVGNTIELGVLVNCTDNCLDCEGDSNKCKKCAPGMYASTEDGLCRDCDVYEDQQVCLNCAERDDKKGADCTECAKGFVLKNGECKPCELDRCADCSTDLTKCSNCFEGQVYDPIK